MIAVSHRENTIQIAAALLLLAVCGLPARWAWGWTGHVRNVLRDGGLNRTDYDRIERGYYEQINTAARKLDDQASTRSSTRPQKPFDAGILAIVVNDAREFVLKPSFSAMHRGAHWNTNSHGQRDRERSISKPSGCYRIALVGDSIGTGWGVEDDQGLTRVLEASLQQRGLNVEVLNFAVPGHAPGQRWEHFNKVGWEFAPDLILFEGTAADPSWDEHRIRAFVARGLGADSHVYGGLLAELGLRPGTPSETTKIKLKPYRDRLLDLVYDKVTTDCRSHGVPCAWLLLPRVGKPCSSEDREKLSERADRAGFAYKIDLTESFDGFSASSLAIAPDDYHPNAAGHAILARGLMNTLSHAGLLPTSTSDSQGGEPR